MEYMVKQGLQLMLIFKTDILFIENSPIKRLKQIHKSSTELLDGLTMPSSPKWPKKELEGDAVAGNLE